MNDGDPVEISKHMYGSDRKKQHNKSDEIERLPDLPDRTSSDLGKIFLLSIILYLFLK